MGTLGSASIKLNLDRSQFDSDLTKLQQQDAGQIAYRIKLDTKDFERQIKGLSKLVSPVFIPLEIDTKTFDQQIKKLSTSIDPIKVDLAPNVKDFQEKLRRLSKITPVTVDIKVDEAKVRQQFETIGKYAAEGFTQGFSGVEGAGKSAIESMVKSVNKQLGIQSPSKVFREIGKYAIAGLMQGLDSVDESKLKGVTNKIEGYFKKSKIKINVDIDASGISGRLKVQAPTPAEKPAAIAQNISKSIEDGFQKAKPKANFLGAIFGGLGSLITIPLAATLRGAFEGIGTPLGLQLGTGVSKALQSTLGQSIGSLELISQRAVEKSLQAIPAAQSAIVGVIKANPIGGAIAKQLESLQRTLELYSINLSPKNAVKSLATDEERAVASSSANFESITTRSKSRKKAKAAASDEFVLIVDQKGEVDKISELIKKKEQELTAKAKKLQSAQNAIASLQDKQEKLASLPAPKTTAEATSRIATDASLKKQITEMSQVLAGGSLTVEQDIKDIQSLKDAKNAYLEKLNKQIKILAELGIEKDLSGETAEILKGIDVFEQLLSAQKAVAEVQKNIKTNAKTSASIRPKKLQKLEGQAKDARTNLEQAIASPDATPEQVQKLQKRAAAANKALDLYRLEISDPAKEIEKLNQKLANGNAALAKNIQELQTRLTQAIPALFREASQETVKVSNLDELQPQNLVAVSPLKAQQKVAVPPIQSQIPATIPHAPTKPKAKKIQANYDVWDLENHEYSQSLESNSHKENLERSLEAVKTDKYMMATPKGLLDIQKQNQLSDAEIKVLQAYTQGPYRLINAYLRESKAGLEKEIHRIQEASLKLGSEKVNQLYGGDYNLPVEELETHVATLAKSLQSTLGKLPNHSGVVFRGEGGKEDIESIQQRLNQEELTSLAFTSSGVQEGFAGKAQYAIKSRSGKMIQVPGAQGVDKAGEVLHGQGQKFRIVSQQSAASELAIPSSFSANEAELIKQTFTPEKLKSLGAEVIVFLEEIDTVVEESLVAIKETTPKTKASYKAWDTETPTMKEALATDNLSHAYTRGKKLAPQLSKQYGLTADEEAALAAYTATGLFDVINSYLRGGTAELQKAVERAKQRIATKRESGLSEEEIQKRLLTDFPIEEGLEERVKVYAETFSSALAKMPASHQNDLVFRGTGATDVVKDHLPGSEHTFPAFTSVAEKNPFATPAQLVILPKSAKNITPFAPLANLSKELGGASFGSELALDRNTRTRVIARKELSLPEKRGEVPLDLSNIQGLSKEQIQKIKSQYTPDFIKKSGTEIIVVLEEIQKEIGSALGSAASAIASVQKEIQPIAHEFLDIPKVELPSPQSNPELEFNSSKDVRQFASKNLNAKGMKDLARRMGIDTKNTNKEYLLNEITSLSGTADSRKQIAQLVSQLTPDKFLSASQAKPTANSSADASKAISELKKARKVLADTLKIAQELDAKEQGIVLEQLIENAQEQEAIAKQLSSEHQLTPAHSKSLGGVRSQFKNISDQSKQSLVAIQINENPGDVGQGLGANLVSAIGSGMSTAAKKPIKEIQSVMGAIEGAAKDKAEIRSPSRVFQRIGKFIAEGLAVGISQGAVLVEKAIATVIDQGKKELSPETISEVLEGTVAGLNVKLDRFKATAKIAEDIQSDDVKKAEAKSNSANPDKRDNERDTIRQRSKLSAKLERKYGMEGLAPEILPDRINSLGEVQKSPSILQGIKDIFKSLDNSLAKRVKKRAAQLAIEVDTAIAPSLETGAIDAGTRGDKVEQKQYQKLARQSRAATKGIAKILETPGDLTEKQVKQLDRLTSQLEKVYDAIGRPLPSQGFLESIGIGASGAIGLVKNLGGVLKGFLAFNIGMWAQNFFGSVAQEAFKAYVELDRLKTALNFASGGDAGGAQNLAFVRKTVEDLRVPLKASAEGFTQLAAASRNSALEGKGTREIFLGISQASTVLSLSAEDTQGTILALSQMISKGKVSSEELRQQLGERLPGAMGIAARAMGVTETEFTRLLDTGQILSQDFLPKFAKQLQAEFGDAAKDASGNAQSAIFGVQNAFLSLQQGIGEGVSPAATAGLNVFAVILKGLSSVAKELGFILLGVTVTLGVKMASALQAVIAQLIATKFATGTLGGGMQALGQTINNSFSVKLTAGIFAILEVINLLNQAVNTELVQSFSKAADAAKRAAEESKKAFDKPKLGQENQGTEPVATSGVGRAMDSVIGFLNTDLGPIPGGIFGKKIKTYGQYERDSTANSIEQQGLSNTESLGEARYRLAQFKTGTGEGGKLRGIDAELKAAEEQRAILQAQIKRDFVDKGQAIPANSKRQLDSQNLKVTALNDQRSEAAKPLTLELNRTTQKINSIKTQIEQLDNPDNIAALGGEAAADKQRQNLKIQLEPLKQFKAEMETALGSLRIDPILAFTQSLRKLNLALAEGQEKSELRFNQSRAAIASTQLKGFSTNKLATRNASLQSAVAERDKNQSNVSDLEKADSATDATVSASGFQTTLQRLGVAPDASVAKIDDVLKNTTDEADKGILEKLKSAREQKNKLSEARVGLSESQLKVKQTTQDNSLYSIDESAANSRAATTKTENQNITGIKKALELKVLTEEVANEKISRIQLASTRSQQKSLDGQLSALHTYYDQGAISAEEFAKRERELTTEQTNLEKQEAENRLAVQQSVLARRLKEIEFFNKKAEALTATKQADSTRTAKEKLLSSGLTPQAQDQFSLDQTSVDATSASDRVKSIQVRIAQNKQLYKEGSKDARDFMLEQYALNQELASANLAVVDQKITAEEKYRETVEHNIQHIMQAEENRFKKQTSELDESKTKLDLYNQSLERTNRLEQSRRNLSKALSDAAIAPLENKKADGDDALALVEKLKDPKLKPQVKAAIKAQLEKLGFAPQGGVTVTPATVTKSSSGDTPEDLELRIKEKQAQIENEIENKKQKALEMEQEFQRKTLENDLKRQKIAAQIALYEAQSAQLAAQKAKNEAEGALKIAIAKKDPVAIETAQTNLEIANKQIGLSNERIASAQANLNDQPEIAANAIQEQKATQGAETSSLQATINRSDRVAALNLVESSAQVGKPINLSEAEAKARSTSEFALPQKIDINQMPKLDLKPGENIFDAYQRQRDGMKLPTGAKADIPPVDKTALAINSTSIQPREQSRGNQFVEALKMANQGIEQQLATLNDRILQLANTPRSLTVQTPNPVDDAAKLMNDFSRGQVVGAGM